MFPEAYDPLDPNGNITIKWDILSWAPDGYIVSTFSYYIRNFLATKHGHRHQTRYRH